MSGLLTKKTKGIVEEERKKEKKTSAIISGKAISGNNALMGYVAPEKVNIEDLDDKLITKDMFKQALPKGMRVMNMDVLIDSINELVTGNDLMRDNLRDNIVGFSSVLREGGYRALDYVNAVKFVSFKIMNKSVVEAWAGTFPQRYQRLIDKGISEKDISSHAGQYSKTKLVTAILEQSLIPTHILNADIYQRAINTQAMLMVGAESEKVRCDAANSLLTHLKAPEVNKIELDISYKEDKSISELRETIIKLGEVQKQAIINGMPVVDIAHSKVIGSSIIEDGEIVNSGDEYE